MYALIIILATILISIVISPISPMETVAHRDGCHRWHSCPSDDEAMFVEIWVMMTSVEVVRWVIRTMERK
jgi:hypothetical protein